MRRAFVSCSVLLYNFIISDSTGGGAVTKVQAVLPSVIEGNFGDADERLSCTGAMIQSFQSPNYPTSNYFTAEARGHQNRNLINSFRRAKKKKASS